MQEVLIKELPVEERPRERLMAYGAHALSNAELLAIVLRTGTKKQSVLNLAKSILIKTEGIKYLNETSINELIEVPGIGTSKAVQIMASIELGKRVSQSLVAKQNKIQTVITPEDCFNLLGNEMKYLKQEHFVVLSLNVKQQLIAKDIVFIGALNMSLVHPREVFRTAVKRMADSIICVHNHPSGDVTPSLPDIMMTKQLVEASLMMDIPLLDHVIIGGNDYSSLKAYGHM
ncbi:MAG: DNA repair protein RadC [Defluviitaleaceae bacterium]|nr:DNA repair protein RadC [Defluviitaleaceae bacterium]